MADALREVFAEFGIEFDDAQLQKGAQSVQGVISGVRQLAQVIAGNAIVGAIREFANAFEEQAGRLEDTAGALGTTTRALQEMRFAAVSAGLSTEQADGALQRFQQTVADAAASGGRQAETLRAIGVQARGADGQVRPLSELFDAVAAGLGSVEDPARRSQIAVDLFGRSGARLANVLHEGEGGVAALRAELDTLGGGMLPEAIAAAGEYGAATDRNAVALDSLRSVLATALLPMLTAFVTKVTEVSVALVRLARGTHVVELALSALGVAATIAAGRMLRAWLPVLLPFAKVALAIGAIVLVMDDLITLFNGGDSAIGRFLDSTFGLGTSQALVTELKLAFEGLQLVIGESATGVRDLAREVNEFASGSLAGIRAMRDEFVDVWESGAAAFDTYIGPILSRLQRVADAVRAVAGGEVTVGAEAAPGTVAAVRPPPATPAAEEGFFAGIAAEYRNVFGGQNAAMAPERVVSVSTPATRTVATTSRTTVNAPITINGSGDPEATARAAARQLRERERAAHDAAHPVREED